jgi:hypothetical protein
VVTRRRALAAAGAGLLLGGCGAPAEPPPDAELLGPPLAAELGLVDAYERLGGSLGDALAAQARRHVARLRAAGAAPRPAAAARSGDPEEAALALAQGAMAAHVHAVGLLRSGARRTLAAELLTADAQHAAILLGRLGRDPIATAFPDGRPA